MAVLHECVDSIVINCEGVFRIEVFLQYFVLQQLCAGDQRRFIVWKFAVDHLIQEHFLDLSDLRTLWQAQLDQILS